MKGIRNRGATPLLLGVLVMSIFLPLTAMSAGSTGNLAPQAHCTPAPSHVNLGGVSYQVFASLCQPEKETKTVIVTYHGNSYAQYYWDFPFQPERYSFVLNMNERGFAVYNLDRLAVDHAYTAPNPKQPPSSIVTIANDNLALHHIVLSLRNGAFGEKFSHVILAGHSLGGYMAWQFAKDYPHDVDAFLVTGSLHPNSQIATNEVIPLLNPAAQNPKFANAGLDAGYYAYNPGTRSIYYHLGSNVDQRVIDLDNQLMQVTVLQELIDGIGLEATTVSKSIHVPVLVVVGQYDKFGCEPDAIPVCNQQTVLQAEAPYYSPQACLQVNVVPDAGHDINLQRNAELWYTAAAKWINSTVLKHTNPSCGTRS
jgi:pimeloyl-ACP methyl ester carboxylesterase